MERTAESIESQIKAQAPKGATAYRLEVVRGDTARTVPDDLSEDPWTLTPWEAPRGVLEGRYRVLYYVQDASGVWLVVNAEGAVLPAVVIRWAAAGEGDRSYGDQMLELQLDDQRTASMVKEGTGAAEVQRLRSEKVQRDLVTGSAEREMAMAAKATAMAEQFVSLTQRLIAQVGAPPAPRQSFMPVLERLVGAGERLGVALIERRPDVLREAVAELRSAGVLGAADPPDPHQDAGAAAAPQGPPPPPEPAPGGSVADLDPFDVLLARMTPQERAVLQREIADPAKLEAFFARLRRQGASGG